MRTAKKIIAFILCIAIIISAFIFVKAADPPTPSVDLLNNLLKYRSWVLDIIVDGDYEKNPYIDSTEDFSDYAEAVYYRFMDNDAYSALVRCADILYNTDEYATDVLLELGISDLLEMCGIYGVTVPEDKKEDKEYIINALSNALYSLNKSREEKYYDYILNGIFTTTYESGPQISIAEEESTVAESRTLLAESNGIKKIIDNQKDIVKFGTTALEKYKYEVIHDMFPDYSDSVNTYLDSRAIISVDNKLASGLPYTQEMIDEHRSSFSESLYTMAMCQKAETNDEEAKTWRKNIQGEELLSKTNKVLKALGTIISFGNSQLNNYILIESLQSQRESTLNALNSFYNGTTNTKFKSSIASYINLLDESYGNLTSWYKTGIDTLTDENLIYSYGSKFLTKKLSKAILNNASVSAAKLTSSSASVLAAVKITTFLTDKATNVEETVKKVYEIEHTLKMIDLMKKVYNDDLAAYKANKTEENAQQVIDDLMLMKKVRLFACKLAYDSAVNQLASPLGWLMTKIDGDSKDECLESWNNQYQKQIDMILSATIDPIGNKPLELKAGDKLYIYVDSNKAKLMRNGSLYTIGEIAERMMLGLKIDEGDVYFINESSKKTTFYLSSLTMNENCEIHLGPQINLSIYDFSHESGSLKLELNSNLTINKSIDVSGSTVEVSGNNQLILNGDLNISSSTIPRLRLESAKPQFINGNNANIGNLTFTNSSTDGITVTGSFVVKGSFSNNSTYVSGGTNIILSSTASFVGNYCHGDISVNGTFINKDMTFGGNLRVDSNADFGHALIVKGTLIQNCSDLILSESSELGEYKSLSNDKHTFTAKNDLTVQNDFMINNTVFNVEKELAIGGDYNSTESTVTTESLLINGKFAQTFSGNQIITDNLIIDNLSGEGIIFNTNVNVSESISDRSKKITGSGYVVAASGCQIERNIYNGNLTLNGCKINGEEFYVGENLNIGNSTNIDVSKITVGNSMTFNGNSNVSSHEAEIRGNIYVSSGTSYFNAESIEMTLYSQSGGKLTINSESLNGKSINQSEGETILNIIAIELENSLSQSNGTLTFNESAINVKGSLKQNNGTINLNSSSKLEISGDYVQLGTVNSSGVIIVCGDTSVGGKLSGTTFEVKNDLNVSGTFKTSDLILSGNTVQTISGTSITTVDLHFENNSKNGITVSCPVNVSGHFYNNAKKIVGISNIKTNSLDENIITELDGNLTVGNWVCDEDTVIHGDLSISGNVVVKDGKTLTVLGSVNNSGTLSFESDAKASFTGSFSNAGTVSVNGSHISISGVYMQTAGALTVDGDSNVDFNRDAFISGSVTNNNSLVFNNDVRFSKASIGGNGVYEFCGDVVSDSSTFSKPNVKFISKAPQSIEGSTFIFNNITIDNHSKDGMEIMSSVKYYGTAQFNNSNVKHSEKISK